MGQHNSDQRLTYRKAMVDAVNATRKARGVGSKLLVLARKCEDADQFLQLCKVEEAWVLSERAGQMQVDELPQCWTQAKSDIKRSMEKGINLNDVTSYHKMKATKVERNKEARHKTAPAVQPERDAVPVTTVEEALESGDVVDAKAHRPDIIPLPLELVEMVKYLDKLPELDRQRAVKAVTKVAKTHWDQHCQNRNKGKRDKDSKPKVLTMPKRGTGTADSIAKRMRRASSG